MELIKTKKNNNLDLLNNETEHKIANLKIQYEEKLKGLLPLDIKKVFYIIFKFFIIITFSLNNFNILINGCLIL